MFHLETKKFNIANSTSFKAVVEPCLGLTFPLPIRQGFLLCLNIQSIASITIIKKFEQIVMKQQPSLIENHNFFIKLYTTLMPCESGFSNKQKDTPTSKLVIRWLLSADLR